MGLKQQLQAARTAQKQASQKVVQQQQTRAVQSDEVRSRRSKAAREAQEREEALARELAELRAKQNELVEQQESARRRALAEARVDYARRAGAKVAPDVLARILPDVDPGTAEGRQAIEQFRVENAALFAPAKVPAGDLTRGIAETVDANSRKTRTPLAERKVFGVELVKNVVARNLGGDA
jgi:hypothetical protein